MTKSFIVRASVFAVFFVGPTTAAQAQSSRDITAPITGSGSQLRRLIEEDRIAQQARETRERVQDGAGDIQINVEQSGAIRGNLEVKVEIEEEIFNADQAIRLGRIKTVFMQGHLNTPELPSWWMFVHVAQEWLWTDGLEGSRQDRSNVIAEIKPRYQREFGSGLYGLELGFSTEGRWEISRLRLRPFLEYRVSRACRIFGSVSAGYTFLELNQNEPDFAFAAAEPGFSCFVGRMTIVGLYAKAQFGLNVNDDGKALNLDGSRVASLGATKNSLEWRLSPFLHHRFRNSVGLTLWAEVAYVGDDAKNDNFFYEDFWQKVVAFLEYPVEPNLIVYGEFAFRRGDRLLADSNYNANAFGFADDFSYISLGGQMGINYFF